ncbi:MAG: OmpA family protein [Spirosomataceae bacterium]
MSKLWRLFSFITWLSLSQIPVMGQLQSYKKGLSLFEKGYYDQAIRELSKVKDLAPSEKSKLFTKIGDAYRLTNRWTEAQGWYEQAIVSGNTSPELIFYIGYAQKISGQYSAALASFEKFTLAGSQDRVLNERANREINTLKIMDELLVSTPDVVVYPVSSINTTGAEFSPVRFKNQLVFTASKKDKVYANGLPFVGLYQVKINEDLSFGSQAEVFSPQVFDPERNEGTPAFSPDGKMMVFARGNTGKRKDLSPDVDLYLSRLVPGEGWTSPQWISASDSASWDGSPAFSGDGRTIYFSSNRPGGSGGLDIYRVNMDASGRFGKPVNMGKAINTAGDEMFPFVSADGKLFFASDGHPGLGKLDLFEAVRVDGKITVRNLGIPYNSPMDDFGLSLDEDGNAFFSSNRPGGAGDDDVYWIPAPEVPEEEDPVLAQGNKPIDPKNPSGSGNPSDAKLVRYFLAGKIQTPVDAQKWNPLDSATIKIYALTEDSEELLTTLVSQSDGNFGPVAVQADTDYMILAEKKNYLTKREAFTMYGRSIPVSLLTKSVTDTTFYTQLTLEQVFVGKTFRLENIYYDFDKFDIRPDAALELDKLVRILQDNPQIKIEMGSHTDAQGTDMYNARLSQRRAESAVKYLVSKGIDPERLTARGYGETELIILNAKNDTEHQVNRRTEFKVVEIQGED